MKKVLFIATLIFSNLINAQFSGDDVQFFVGEGEQTAYLVVDFKDGTDDRSYAWGFKFNEGEGLTFGSMLAAIQEAEPNFQVETGYGGAFLNDIIFNSHSGIAGSPDYWSTWSGFGSDEMTMNSGISEGLTDGKWYGTSYGFSNPSVEHPAQPLPAYHSLWFSEADIVNWFGEGENQSIVIVDFGTTTEGEFDSFAFGIRYDEESISVEESLSLLQSKVASFSYELNENELTQLSWNNHMGNPTEEAPVKFYLGTDLSNWVTQTDFTSVEITNEKWLGISFGERRPITPTDQTEGLGVADLFTSQLKVYPNPVADKLFINSNEQILGVEIYDSVGRKLKSHRGSIQEIAVQDLKSGIYFVKIQTKEAVQTKKIIVK